MSNKSDISGNLPKVNLGRNLRTIMARRRWTLSRFSDQVQISKSTLHSYMYGMTPRSVVKLKRLADYFGMSLEELIFGPGCHSTQERSGVIPTEQKNGESLEQTIERFLKERSSLGLLSVFEVARLHLHLVDSTLPLLHIGYVRFLKSCGVSAPKVADLSVFWIGEYHEFLHQNYGELVMQDALDSLWAVWDWANQNGYIDEKMPGQLDDPRTPPSFRTTLKIAKPHDPKP